MTTGASTVRKAPAIAEQARRSAIARMAGYAEQLEVLPGRLVEEAARQFVNSLLIPFEFEGTSPRVGFVIKIVQDPDVIDAAVKEFDHLTLLHPSFAAYPTLRVPRPLDCYPQLDAIVLERVFAPKLEQLIVADAHWRSRSRPGSSATHCRRCGRWLQTLRQTTSRPSRPIGQPTDDVVRLWTRELSAMLERAAGLGLDPALLRDLETYLNQPTCNPRHRVSLVHSDFTAYNVRASVETVFVTDFAELPPGLTEQSAAFFWAWCELLKAHPWLSEVAVTRCQHAFEAGFGQRLSTFWQVWGVLRHYSYFQRTTDQPAGPKRWLHRWRLARARSWLAAKARTI